MSVADRCMSVPREPHFLASPDTLTLTLSLAAWLDLVTLAPVMPAKALNLPPCWGLSSWKAPSQNPVAMLYEVRAIGWWMQGFTQRPQELRQHTQSWATWRRARAPQLSSQLKAVAWAAPSTQKQNPFLPDLCVPSANPGPGPEEEACSACVFGCWGRMRRNSKLMLSATELWGGRSAGQVTWSMRTDLCLLSPLSSGHTCRRIKGEAGGGTPLLAIAFTSAGFRDAWQLCLSLTGDLSRQCSPSASFSSFRHKGLDQWFSEFLGSFANPAFGVSHLTRTSGS